MPEGDTVFAAADRLRNGLAGKIIDRSDFRVPALATVDLSGREVTSVRSVGKHLLIDVAESTDNTSRDPRPVSIHSHLKMEGVWHVHRIGTRWRRPAYQARIVLRAGGTEAVGFDLGVLELLHDPDDRLAYLGPDLLDPDWDRDEAIRRLEAHPDLEIGLALLDQRLMAGVGNVYRCEVCFLRRVLPTRPVSSVDIPAMVDLCRRTLWDNRLRTARTTTGQNAPNARTWVYGRGGQLCRRCATPIELGFMGPSGEDRVIYYCPVCQQ